MELIFKVIFMITLTFCIIYAKNSITLLDYFLFVISKICLCIISINTLVLIRRDGVLHDSNSQTLL